MNPLLKTAVNALIAGFVGGTAPAITGADWSTIVITGIVSIVIALINLWQHKPNGTSSMNGAI